MTIAAGNEPGALLEAARADHRAGRLEDAATVYRRILDDTPDHAEAMHLLGIVHHQTGRNQEAAILIGRAVATDPGNARYLCNLASVHIALGDAGAAGACSRDAIARDPESADGHYNLGRALDLADQPADAADSYRRAIAIDPDAGDVHYNLGIVLSVLGDTPAAEASFRRAMEIDPTFADAHINLGSVLSARGEMEEAEASFRRATEIDPRAANAHYNLGNTLRRLNRLDEAIDCLRRALDIRPEFADAAANLAQLLLRTCAWAEYEALAPRLDRLTDGNLEAGARTGETPFLNINRYDDPGRNYRIARSWGEDLARRAEKLRVRFPAARNRNWRYGDAITVGYLSSDFRNHAVAHLMRGVYALHDRNRVRVMAYSCGPDDGSRYRREIEADSDGFADVAGLGAAEAARRIHADGVDVLVDLNGHTTGGRLDICALRPAPVQATYLGYPGTTGGDFMDYIIADAVVAPPEHAAHFSEHLVHLPHCYQANDNAQVIAAGKTTRQQAGLPVEGFVFCSFNRTLKVEPVMFAVWMRLLGGVPGSVLWMPRSNPTAEANLRAEAEARGIAGDRLIFAPEVAKDEHLARFALADLALDTRIYGGHTTTSDALWAGVPVIGLQGGHFASRVSSSILIAAALGDLVARNLKDYEDLALGLAGDANKLAALRQRLAGCRLRAPLFDTPRLVRNLEAAYAEMWKIFNSGAKPRAIRVRETD